MPKSQMTVAATCQIVRLFTGSIDRIGPYSYKRGALGDASAGCLYQSSAGAGRPTIDQQNVQTRHDGRSGGY